MKEQILKLREEGKSYSEIKEILSCSKSTISYYLGDGQKEKTRNRTRKIRESVIKRRLETFKGRKKKNFVESVRKYQKRKNNKIDNTINPSFSWKNVVEKFGEETECYLTGKKINLLVDEDYSLDHIIPVSKGGDNSLSNLGILSSEVNMMKTDLTINELTQLCIKILEKQGYKIEK